MMKVYQDREMLEQNKIRPSSTLSSAVTLQGELPSPLQKEVTKKRMEDIEMNKENQKIKKNIKYRNTILL